MSDIKSKAITLVPIKDIKLNPNNRNKHPKEQIEQLCAIIKYQGFRNPVVVSNRSGQLIAGEGRFQAARKLKLKEIPVIYQDFDSEDQEVAYGISDNAISLWSELDLGSISKDLLLMDPDFDKDLLGIKNFNVDILGEEGLIDDDEIPSVVEPQAKLGDIYSLGDHRLMCGDSKSINAIDKLTEKKDIDLLLTDPPYGMSVVKKDGMIGGNRKAWKGKAKAETGVYRPIIGDDEPFDPNMCFGLATNQIIFGANHFSDKLPLSPHWIVWYKDMPVGTDFSGAELAWTSFDKKSVKTYKFTWAGMTRQGNRVDEMSKRIHPTQKPVGLFEMILNDYECKTVLDLFGGSGTTLIACQKTKRQCFMMEMDPLYVDQIIARWEKFTGQKATLLSELDVSNASQSHYADEPYHQDDAP